MNPMSRRHVLAASAGGLLTASALTNAQAASSQFKPGDGGIARQAVELPPGEKVTYHDPKDVAALPDFRFSLDGNIPKVTSGGWAKEATVHQFPISKGIAGVHMFLDPGASRELHWHAIAAEWALVIDGRCQTVVLDPSGASEINNYGPGDLWYFPKGHGHSIQTIGDKPWPKESTHKWIDLSLVGQRPRPKYVSTATRPSLPLWLRATVREYEPAYRDRRTAPWGLPSESTRWPHDGPGQAARHVGRQSGRH